MQVKTLGEYMRKLVDSNVMSFRKNVVIPTLDEMASAPHTHGSTLEACGQASVLRVAVTHTGACQLTAVCVPPCGDSCASLQTRRNKRSCMVSERERCRLLILSCTT